MKKFLLTTALALLTWSTPSFGQQATGRTVEGTNFPGIQHFRNLVKNPNCQKNAANITAASVSMTANTTSAPINGISDCTWDPTATAQEISWAIDTMPSGTKGGNCEARLSYRGDASLVSFFVRNSSGPVANGVSLTNSDQAGSTASINYPCSDGTAVPVLRSTGNAASVQYSVYTGAATNLLAVSNVSDWVSYTPTYAGMGTVTNTYAQWKRVGDSIIISVKFTTGTTAASTASITLPNSLTANVPATGVFGVVVGAGSNPLVVPSILASSASNLITFGVQGSGITSGNGSSIFNSSQVYSFTTDPIPITGWTSSDAAVKNSQTYYPRYEATIVADASFSLASDVTQNGNWITSGSRDTQAAYTMTFATGTFSATPICTVSVRRNLANTRYTVSAWVTSVSSSSVTFSWGANDDQGASIAAAIAVIDDSGTFDLVCTSTTATSLPVPVLIGGYTSSSISALRQEYANITPLTSSCNINSQSGDWVSSLSCSVNGDVTLTLKSGYWSSINCTVTMVTTDTSGSVLYASRIHSQSTSSIRVIGAYHNTDADKGLAGNPFDIHCIGTR